MTEHNHQTGQIRVTATQDQVDALAACLLLFAKQGCIHYAHRFPKNRDECWHCQARKALKDVGVPVIATVVAA